MAPLLSGSFGTRIVAGLVWVTGWTTISGPNTWDLTGASHAGNRPHRRPMGRRGQGQGHRPSRRPHQVGRPLSGWQQRGAHRGAARRRELRAAPHPLGGADARRHQRHRQRSGDRSGCAARRAEGPRGTRRRHLEAVDLRRRAPADALSRGHRQGDRTLHGQQEDRHHRPRHRALLSGQDRSHRNPGSRRARRGSAHPQDRSRTGIQEPGAGQDLQPQSAGRGAARRGPAGTGGELQAPHRRHPAAAQQRAGGRRDGPAGRLAGHAARRRPRHVSLRDLV